MKKIILVLFILCSTLIFAQEKNELVFGGTISADLGRFNDRIEVIPSIHKKILKKTYLGIGLTIANYKQESNSVFYIDEQYYETKNKTSTFYYGGSMFLRYYAFENKQKSILKNLFLQTEIEHLKGKGTYKDSFGKTEFKTTNTTLFSGIGFKHLMGNKIALTSSLLFKLNSEEDSPYKNPIFRIGIEF